MITARDFLLISLCGIFCAFAVVEQFQLEEKNKVIVERWLDTQRLKIEIDKRDSLIRILQVVKTPERKRGNHKNLKYRIYALDKYKTVTPNELSEILMEIVVEIEKLDKP